MGIAFLAVLAAVGAKRAVSGLCTDVTVPDKYPQRLRSPRRPRRVNRPRAASRARLIAEARAR